MTDKLNISLLKNNISLWRERWLFSSNAKDIGTCATRALAFVIFAVWYANSSIIGECSSNISYLSYGAALIFANNWINGVAGVERRVGVLLPGFNKSIKDFWHDYAKKLDTYWQAWVGLFVLSRISRQIIGNLKAIKRCSDLNGNLEAKCHSSEESNKTKVTNAQESKSEEAISEPTDKKGKAREPLEGSASTSKRGKSPRSSPERKNPNSRQSKEGSEKAPVKKQRSRIPVHSLEIRMFVKSQLGLYTNKDGRYNGIVRILADAGFLQYCYMLTKGKPGNMSKGATEETLDGISYEWFVKTADDIKKGGLKFTRRVMIPKPGKKEERPLGVGAPREKIIQKGMQVILETIYEERLIDCYNGFRPHRYTNSAIRHIYLKGHQNTWVIQGDI